MASNLTPERKEKLKKEVLDEIDKAEKFTKKPSIKKISEVKKPLLTKDVKIEKKPLNIESKIIKNPIKEKINKTLPTKPLETPPIIKPKKIKKIAKKKTIKATEKSVKVARIKKVKISKTVVSPAPSPIAKKAIPFETIEAKIRSRESFFRPDSSIKSVLNPQSIFKSKIRSGHQKFWWLGIICLVLALIIALGINILGIYKLGWSGPVSQKIIQILPLPAGSVDGRLISLSDYYHDLNIVKTVLASSPDSPAFDSDKTKDQLFNRLVSINIIEFELKKYNKDVTGELIDAEMAKVVAQIGSIEQATKDINNIYGMDIATFKNNVLKPILAVTELNKLINSDETLAINQEARKNAEDALALAQTPGTDFKTLVLQYANDPATLDQGGDLGRVSRGELPTDIEDALFSLNSGEVYNQVVKDDYGYHIYKIESKLVDEESGQESIKLNQILITVNAELYIKSLFDQAVIKRYI